MIFSWLSGRKILRICSSLDSFAIMDRLLDRWCVVFDGDAVCCAIELLPLDYCWQARASRPALLRCNDAQPRFQPLLRHQRCGNLTSAGRVVRVLRSTSPRTSRLR
jgi:hypothetical protein